MEIPREIPTLLQLQNSFHRGPEDGKPLIHHTPEDRFIKGSFIRVLYDNIQYEDVKMKIAGKCRFLVNGEREACHGNITI